MPLLRRSDRFVRSSASDQHHVGCGPLLKLVEHLLCRLTCRVLVLTRDDVSVFNNNRLVQVCEDAMICLVNRAPLLQLLLWVHWRDLANAQLLHLPIGDPGHDCAIHKQAAICLLGIDESQCAVTHGSQHLARRKRLRYAKPQLRACTEIPSCTPATHHIDEVKCREVQMRQGRSALSGLYIFYAAPEPHIPMCEILGNGVNGDIATLHTGNGHIDAGILENYIGDCHLRRGRARRFTTRATIITQGAVRSGHDKGLLTCEREGLAALFATLQ
mmetsp:Transcript_64790/g.163130  ORF Transcript_64790/g.163130 Transcript_64790/m.163130 type:complete len:273 (+) Transcript_64790:142-960(+)